MVSKLQTCNIDSPITYYRIRTIITNTNACSDLQMQAYKDLYNDDQGMAEEEVLSSDGAVPEMVEDWPAKGVLKLGQVIHY